MSHILFFLIYYIILFFPFLYSSLFFPFLFSCHFFTYFSVKINIPHLSYFLFGNEFIVLFYSISCHLFYLFSFENKYPSFILCFWFSKIKFYFVMFPQYIMSHILLFYFIPFHVTSFTYFSVKINTPHLSYFFGFLE